MELAIEAMLMWISLEQQDLQCKTILAQTFTNIIRLKIPADGHRNRVTK